MSIVICPPIIDWDYMRQRPQQLMSQFAKNNHIVLYFNKTPQAGPVVTQPEENVFVINHPNVFMDHIYPLIVSEYKEDTIYWTSWSKMIPLHTLFNSNFLVYDCVDDFPDWEEDETKYTNTCDIIVCSADKLVDKMRTQFPHKPIYRVLNGCDWDYFSTLLHTPPTISDILRIGYIGAWAPWVDTDLIRTLSSTNPSAELHILGPDFLGDQDTYENNVQFYGHVSYEHLLEHLKKMDVLILPFRINRITESTNPVKIYEYLATGKPVVSTALPEISKMSSVVYVAKDLTEFVEKIDIAYKDREKNTLERSYFAKEHSWEERFKNISRILSREFSEFNTGPVQLHTDIVGYSTRWVPMNYCTVNSYYGNENLRHDPIFVGKQEDYEYQCYFKAKYLATFHDVVRVYFELDYEISDDIEYELILSKPTKPWFTHQLTYNRKPEVEYLFSKTVTQSLINTVTMDVTAVVRKDHVPMFHLSSNQQKLLRFINPRLTFVLRGDI